MFAYIKLLALSLVQDSIIFKPKPSGILEIKEPKEYGLDHTDDKVLVTEDNEKIHYWIKKPAPSDRPYVVFFTGNAGHMGDVGKPEEDEEIDRGYRVEFLKSLQKKGYGFIAVSLRGFGNSTGKPSEEGFVKDIKAIADFIEKEKLKVILVGESMGAFSALTLMLQLENSNNKPVGVALIAPFSTLEEKAYETHPEFKSFDAKRFLKYRFDNKKIISETGYRGKILILTPADDKTTGPYHSQVLLEEGKKKDLDIKLIMLQNSGHVTWDPDLVTDYISSEIK